MGYSMRFYISATLKELAKLESDQWRKSAWEKDMSNNPPSLPSNTLITKQSGLIADNRTDGNL